MQINYHVSFVVIGSFMTLFFIESKNNILQIK